MRSKIVGRRTFLACVAGAAVAPLLNCATTEVPTLLDHFILGCDDLDRGIDFVEKHTGVRAAFGGVHPGRGTRNALLSFGERRYLEIMAPDPAQHVGISRLRELKEPRIVGWAAHVDNMDQLIERLGKADLLYDGPRAGSRQRPDGKLLQWKTLTLKDDHRGLLPFFIEWGRESIHPSVDAPKGCKLRRFDAATPEQENLLHAVSVIGLDLRVDTSSDAVLRATTAGPKGAFAITS
jgi:catechol 2,3-dioxygenase-like lactoylglutathione lyase family enzyme